MAKIQFRAKVASVFNHDEDETLAWQTVKVPTLTRSHCDMDAFRKHPKFGGYANSTLFPAMLARIARDVAPYGYIKLDKVPDNVTVDTSGFLALVTIEA